MNPNGKMKNCEVCAANRAKYTCPKCEVRTCCLTCSTIHKKELECDGIRDKIKFIRKDSLTDAHLMSDYCLLQEVGRSIDRYNRDPLKRCTNLNSLLPKFLRVMKNAAFRRGTILEFLPRAFSRRRKNTSRFLWKVNELLWRIEWVFPQAENAKWVTERASENARLSILFENILEPEIQKDEIPDSVNLKRTLRKKLSYYRAAGLSGIKFLLKAEKVKKCDSKFYELDPTMTLKENLEHKTIIEYPIICVILSYASGMYNIIDSDDEEKTTVVVNENSNRLRFKKNQRNFSNKNFGRNDKQTGIINDEAEAPPVNYLFYTEYSDSEDEESRTIEKERKNMKCRIQQRKKFKKTLKIQDSLQEFTGICKSDPEDEMTMEESSAMKMKESNGKNFIICNDRVEKPLQKLFLNSHITDSEDESPEEQSILRMELDEDKINSEGDYMRAKNKGTENEINKIEGNEDQKQVENIALNYFGAYMSNSEDENIPENLQDSRTINNTDFKILK